MGAPIFITGWVFHGTMAGWSGGRCWEDDDWGWLKKKMMMMILARPTHLDATNNSGFGVLFILTWPSSSPPYYYYFYYFYQGTFEEWVPKRGFTAVIMESVENIQGPDLLWALLPRMRLKAHLYLYFLLTNAKLEALRWCERKELVQDAWCVRHVSWQSLFSGSGNLNRSLLAR